MLKKVLILSALGIIALNGIAQKKYKINKQQFTVAFYNVENLFDTLDSPTTKDEEYLPTSEKNWNTAKYNQKLANLSQVIHDLGNGEFVEIVGLCEVENAQVVKDLAATKALKKAGYKVVHHESNDKRGIDNALLYQPKEFKVIDSKTVNIQFEDTSLRSRPILVVHGEVLAAKQELYVLVNHWPSRYGGEEKSRPNRIAAARTAKAICDSITAKNPNASIVLIGDFNDYADNASLHEVLNAGSFTQQDSTQLFNLMYDQLIHKNVGSHNYNCEWGYLDQIIISKPLKHASSGLVMSTPALALKQDYQLYFDKKCNQHRPSRSFGGNKWFGGYSDHLPVYLRFEIKE